MQFLLVIGHSDADVPQERMAELLPQEGAHAAEKYGDGFLRQVWSRTDGFGVCALLEAESEEQAQAMLAKFPLAVAGVSKIQMLIPLAPYWGFAHP